MVATAAKVRADSCCHLFSWILAHLSLVFTVCDYYFFSSEYQETGFFHIWIPINVQETVFPSATSFFFFHVSSILFH